VRDPDGAASRWAAMLVIAACVLVAAGPLAGSPSPPPPGLDAFRSLDPLLDGLVPSTLYRPAGAGPFPAVVLLHGCSGIGASIYAWARWLRDAGYVALVVNSLGPRYTRSVCVVGGHPTDRDQALDAFGALLHLRSLPWVNPKRIAVIGWSHGGGAVFVAASAPFVNEVLPLIGGFQAAVALYPPCGMFPSRGIAAPMLILMGSVDDWTPPAVCETRVPPLLATGAPLLFHVYPDATHAFDTPAPNRVLHIAGHSFTLRYDADAAADAHVRIAAFLASHLR